MKNLLVVVIVLCCQLSFAQTLTRYVDDMDDKDYLLTDLRGITYDGDSKSDGVIWDFFTTKKDGKWVVTDISLKVVGLGCVEETTVIIMFENDEKITLEQWNKFNCDGNVWLTSYAQDYELLKTQPIKKIRVTNGRNFESFNFSDLEDYMKNFYINLIKSLDEGNENGFVIYEGE
jgi:hypothetical protein